MCIRDSLNQRTHGTNSCVLFRLPVSFHTYFWVKNHISIKWYCTSSKLIFASYVCCFHRAYNGFCMPSWTIYIQGFCDWRFLLNAASPRPWYWPPGAYKNAVNHEKDKRQYCVAIKRNSYHYGVRTRVNVLDISIGDVLKTRNQREKRLRNKHNPIPHEHRVCAVIKYMNLA